MEIKQHDKKSSIEAVISTEMTINEVTEIWKTLCEHFKKKKTVELNLSRVSNCDTAGIQLLCSAKKTAENAGINFSINAISDCVKTAAECAGIILES